MVVALPASAFYVTCRVGSSENVQDPAQTAAVVTCRVGSSEKMGNTHSMV